MYWQCDFFGMEWMVGLDGKPLHRLAAVLLP
nr:MAG TPA_asm: hypothetical protein [Caudoviricetes sp.]